MISARPNSKVTLALSASPLSDTKIMRGQLASQGLAICSAHDGNLMLLHVVLDLLHVAFCELAEEGWGGDWKLEGVDQESFRPAPICKVDT
jgi:hypothetical protein